MDTTPVTERTLEQNAAFEKWWDSETTNVTMAMYRPKDRDALKTWAKAGWDAAQALESKGI